MLHLYYGIEAMKIMIVFIMASGHPKCRQHIIENVIIIWLHSTMTFASVTVMALIHLQYHGCGKEKVLGERGITIIIASGL